MEEVENIKPYSKDKNKSSQIEKMFDSISNNYDFLNKLLSLGVDKYWRSKAISQLSSISPKRILDMASGTGDFAFEALKSDPIEIIAIDLSEKMLDIAKQKSLQIEHSSKIKFIKGNVEKIDFPDQYFDAITVGFGVRNFGDLNKGLSELNRVLKKGGKIVILEPSFPSNFFLKIIFTLHFKYITPLLGRLISKDKKAYSYLPSSVEGFPDDNKFLDIMTNCNFINNKCLKLSFGICNIFISEK